MHQLPRYSIYFNAVELGYLVGMLSENSNEDAVKTGIRNNIARVVEDIRNDVLSPILEA